MGRYFNFLAGAIIFLPLFFSSCEKEVPTSYFWKKVDVRHRKGYSIFVYDNDGRLTHSEEKEGDAHLEVAEGSKIIALSGLVLDVDDNPYYVSAVVTEDAEITLSSFSSSMRLTILGDASDVEVRVPSKVVFDKDKGELREYEYRSFQEPFESPLSFNFFPDRKCPIMVSWTDNGVRMERSVILEEEPFRGGKAYEISFSFSEGTMRSFSVTEVTTEGYKKGGTKTVWI